MLGGRSPWSLPTPALFFYPSLHFCQWALQVYSRINPSAQLGWERKRGRGRMYQWYCTPVSTEEAPFMGQQNLGEAPDLISLGGSNSRNKENQSLTWQSRHSFCNLLETWAPGSTSMHAGARCARAHTHTHRRVIGFQKEEGDKEAKHLRN